MKFQVPQFIETETKLIGPFTLKQFLWVASGIAFLFLAYLVLPKIIFILISFPIAGVFGSLAFLKIDGTPMFSYIVYILAYFMNPKRYFFEQKVSDVEYMQKMTNTETRK